MKLDPLYLNRRRITNLIGDESVSLALPARPSEQSDKMRENLELAGLARILGSWLAQAQLRSLERLLLSGAQIVPGTLFTTMRDFYCRGIRTLKQKSEAPHMHAKYRGLGKEDGVRLVLNIHHGHVAPGSPGDLLTGRVADLFVVAQVLEHSRDTVTAVPLFVGYKVEGPTEWPLVVPTGACEIFVDSIDTFADVARVPVPGSVEPLRTIPEVQVKNAFAEIIGEPEVPLDWGGERSDLFTTYLRLGGTRVSAAFAFKGPARFSPMDLSHLGKRGDQLERLATEPADLLIVQHCHSIRPPVRTVLRALCNQVGARRRRFCLINGFDTIRLFKAYGKCGMH